MQTLQYFVCPLPCDVLFYMTSRRARLAVNNRHPVSCSLHESWSLGPLEAQCYLSRLALTAFRTTEWSRNKLFDKKEGKKEKDEIWVFEVEQFQTLAVLLQVYYWQHSTIPGKTSYKQNEPVCGRLIHACKLSKMWHWKWMLNDQFRLQVQVDKTEASTSYDGLRTEWCLFLFEIYSVSFSVI